MNAKCGRGGRRYSALVVPGGGAPGGPSGARRLSALVPDAVVRRLSTVSTTLGLATRNNPYDCLIEQGKALCGQYMRSRMSCSGRRWHRHGTGTSWAGARLVFPRLSLLGRHLERARPRLYATIGRHANHSSASTTNVPNLDPADVVYGIGVELFKNNISWGKIVSLMAVCGALANKASRNDNMEDLPELLEAAGAAMCGPLLPWLQSQGGWYGLVEHCQPMEQSVPKAKYSSYCVLATIGGFIVVVIILIISMVR